MVLISSICVALAGLINFLPVIGVISGSRVARIYAVDISDPNLEILLRHRAVLFGCIGAFMIWGAFTDGLFAVSVVIGLVSMGSYMALTLIIGGYNVSLKKVFVADAVGLALLLIGAGIRLVP